MKQVIDCTLLLETIETELQKNGFELLSINSQHIIQSAILPLIHRDPFDRLLIAQAQKEI